jgi:hypothetical protein
MPHRIARFSIATVIALASCVPIIGRSSSSGGTSRDTGPGTDSKPLPAVPSPLVNASGEKLLWKAAQAWAPSVGTPAPTILRAYVVQDQDWVIDRNENTGIITDRFLHAAVIYKGGQTGVCRQSLCNFVEEEAGGSWQAPQLSCPNGLTVALTCDSVEPLRPSPPE